MSAPAKPTGSSVGSRKQLETTSARLGAAVHELGDAEMVTVEQIGLAAKTPLPKTAVEAMAEAMSIAARGRHARVLVVEDEISTGKAAELLGVSRPHLVGLLDAGHIPFRTTSEKRTAHRYLKLDDVLDYKRRRQDADEALDEYVEVSEELGV